MQKILRKRIIRDLRENLFRYLALGFLVVIGMYMIIGMVGAADTVIFGTRRLAETNNLEDGQFSLFAPLSAGEKEVLEKNGAVIEEHFSLDYAMKKNVTLRIFQVRKKIDRIQVDQGRLPKKAGEILLEKRYCEEKKIALKDSLSVGGHTFQVVGIGSVPDYEATFANLSDSAVNSSQFGIGFLIKEDYQMLKSERKSMKSEEYLYAYRLDNGLTNQKLKEKLQDFTMTADNIEDAYFQEYWDRTGGKLDDFKDGLSKLTDGADSLSDGLSELKGYSRDLTDGAGEIFNAYLKEASNGLEQFGIQELTKENYEAVLDDLIAKNEENALVKMKLKSILEQLKELDAFESGTLDYTNGVSKSEKGAEKLANGLAEFSDETIEFVDENFDTKLSKLTQFLPAEDNMRIGAAADDKFVDKAAGLVAGVIVLILFAYVISVFVVHTIEEEAFVIGTLYAMGVKKKELLAHYMTLPVLITFIGGLVGTGLGYCFSVSSMLEEPYGYFSMPQMDILYEPYLLVYGILLPPVAAIVTNYFVIRKKLSQPALSLIRNEHKSKATSKAQIKNKGFVQTFQIRQFLREKRTSFTVFFGMFICLLIVMLTLDCYVICNRVKEDSAADTKFEYMYTYKYPEKTVPKGGTPAYGVSLKKEVNGFNFDITLLGIGKDNPYFDADVKKGENKVVLSSAMAQKYHFNVGDELTLKDESEDKVYAFQIDGVTQYATGFYAFMDIDSMRDLMGEDEDYYNIVFSDHKLEIDTGRLYSTLSKAEVKKSSSVFAEMMQPMVVMLSVLSAAIFIIVMYLMMKVMIDRSSTSISLMKIFGYRKKEIRKLYLDGNLFTVMLSALVGIPITKIVIDALFPAMVANVACGLNLTIDWWMYVGLFGVILVLYLLINPLLMRRVNRILPAEVLKDRE